MSKPKGTVSKKIEKKLRDYFAKIEKENANIKSGSSKS